MFEKINIKKVESVVNFAGKNTNVFGEDSRNEIPLLQSRGVTALCKILSTRKYAYLADEVGMGKTYQALGVIAMLINERPSAKILVITPGKNVQDNWEREINRFKDKNLIVSMKYRLASYDRPKDFMEEIVGENDLFKNNNIFLLRLSSFSSVAANIVGNEARKEGRIRRKELEDAIYDVFTGYQPLGFSKKEYDTSQAGCVCGWIFNRFNEMPKFDLVIIDEAQNIRNDNNATQFLDAWLGFKRFEKDRKLLVG